MAGYDLGGDLAPLLLILIMAASAFTIDRHRREGDRD
jgi:hypothetical protein